MDQGRTTLLEDAKGRIQLSISQPPKDRIACKKAHSSAAYDICSFSGADIAPALNEKWQMRFKRRGGKKGLHKERMERINYLPSNNEDYKT